MNWTINIFPVGRVHHNMWLVPKCPSPSSGWGPWHCGFLDGSVVVVVDFGSWVLPPSLRCLLASCSSPSSGFLLTCISVKHIYASCVARPLKWWAFRWQWWKEWCWWQFWDDGVEVCNACGEYRDWMKNIAIKVNYVQAKLKFQNKFKRPQPFFWRIWLDRCF